MHLQRALLGLEVRAVFVHPLQQRGGPKGNPGQKGSNHATMCKDSAWCSRAFFKIVVWKNSSEFFSRLRRQKSGSYHNFLIRLIPIFFYVQPLIFQESWNVTQQQRISPTTGSQGPLGIDLWKSIYLVTETILYKNCWIPLRRDIPCSWCPLLCILGWKNPYKERRKTIAT